MWPYLEWVFASLIKVRWRPTGLGWALIPWLAFLEVEGNLNIETEDTQGEHHVTMRVEMWGCLCMPRNSMDYQQQPEARREARKGPPLAPLEEARPWFWTSSSRTSSRESFSVVLICSFCDNLFQQPHKTSASRIFLRFHSPLHPNLFMPLKMWLSQTWG